MRAASQCAQCATPLSNDAPEGFCPACMLEGALQLGSNETPPSSLPSLGEYQLLEEIARGGMGVVYRARQISLNRIVAVKLILTGQFADKSGIRRFQAEAAAAAKLRHPNIIAIYEIGEQSGQHYFSMEYVEGQNLADFMREQPISIRQAAHLVKKIADAIHYAHQQGIIHRDLKPSNILIDPLVEPRITDFGLARDLQNNSDLTLTGQVLGSPNYISPEQARSQSAGAPSDIYSLGAILYHLLTARPPFAAETLADTLKQAAEHDPVAPRLLNPSIPRDLETLCLKCLEKDPAQRYSSAAELSEELTRFLNDEPIHARPLSAPGKAWRWCRRKPVIAGLILAFVGSVLAGLLGVTWQWRQAVQRAEESRYNEYISDMLRAQNELIAENTRQARNILGKHLPRPGEKDLRNWEWYYAWNESQGDELSSFEAYDLPVLSLAVDMTGTRLAIAGGGPVILWDLEKAQEIRRLYCSNNVNAVCFSVDGRLLFAGTSHDGLFVWNLETGKPDRIITDLPGIRSLRASPNGKFLAVYAHEGLILGSLRDYEAVVKFPSTAGTDNLPGGIAFSLDSSLFAYAREGGDIVLWDVAKTNEITVLRGHKSNVTGLVFSSNDRTLISVSRDGTIRIWEVAPGSEIERLPVSSAFLSALSLSPDGKNLVVGGAAQYLRIFETESWRQIKVLKGHEGPIRSVVWSGNGAQLMSGSRDGTVKYWQTTAHRQPLLRKLPAEVASAELLEGGTGLQISYTDGTCAWWSTSSFEKTSKFQLDEGPIRFSPDGKLFAKAAKSGVEIFDTSSGRLVQSIPLRYTGGRTMKFSRDGRFLAVLGYEHQCQVLKVNQRDSPGENSSLVASFRPSNTNGPVTALKFSSNSTQLGLVYQRMVEVWTISSTQRVRLETNWDQNDIAISADGRLAVTSCAGGQLRIWNPRTGQQVAALGGQLGTLWAVEFSPDESRIAACGGDGTVRIWDRKTFQDVASLKIDNEPLGQVVFSMTGELFVLRLGFGGAVSRYLFTLRAPKGAQF